jgi:hypothetical protein
MLTIVTSPQYMLAVKRATRSGTPILLGRVILVVARFELSAATPCGVAADPIFLLTHGLVQQNIG